MWGGRFYSSPAAIMEEINASIDFDKRLWRHDILASKAHAAMLAENGIIGFLLFASLIGSFTYTGWRRHDVFWLR